jgi:hypothetical protein
VPARDECRFVTKAGLTQLCFPPETTCRPFPLPTERRRATLSLIRMGVSSPDGRARWLPGGWRIRFVAAVVGMVLVAAGIGLAGVLRRSAEPSPEAAKSVAHPLSHLPLGWSRLPPPPEVRDGASFAWAGSKLLDWGAASPPSRTSACAPPTGSHSTRRPARGEPFPTRRWPVPTPMAYGPARRPSSSVFGARSVWTGKPSTPRPTRGGRSPSPRLARGGSGVDRIGAFRLGRRASRGARAGAGSVLRPGNRLVATGRQCATGPESGERDVDGERGARFRLAPERGTGPTRQPRSVRLTILRTETWRELPPSALSPADRFPHRGLARIGQRRDDGSTCVRLHRASLHDLHLHVLHIELFNSSLLLRSSHLRSVEVAQQDLPARLQDEDSPPQQVPKAQTSSALLATGLASPTSAATSSDFTSERNA